MSGTKKLELDGMDRVTVRIKNVTQEHNTIYSTQKTGLLGQESTAITKPPHMT